MTFPLFSPLTKRQAGVLLHLTSLPSPVGVGNLGPAAYQFVDFLKAAGFHYWQMLPIGPTGFGDSPYQSFSSFAGNPYLINLEKLVQDGLLAEADLDGLRNLPEAYVDYGALYQQFWPLLEKAFKRYHSTPKAFPAYQDFEYFKQAQRYWLEPYSLFMALKDHFKPKLWFEWPAPFNAFSSACLQAVQGNFQTSLRAALYSFIQYIFFKDWAALKAYGLKNSISFIGDIPLFVALDSADVWQNPQCFQLDKHDRPTYIAGVPPDCFSAEGQVWGNPLYNWKAIQSDGYKWWIERLKSTFKLFDCARIDHFRGLESYWAIPFGHQNAKEGQWQAGPGIEFFTTLRQTFSADLQLIAENLGIITPEVDTLLQQTGLPGMAILQFAFDSDHTNPYLFHNLTPNQVVYPGSHDNDTAWGWYQQAPGSIQDYFRRYLRVSGTEVPWDLIRAAYQSVAKVAIIPMQDFLNLGSQARMNRPSTALGNWQWRLTANQLQAVTQIEAPYLKSIANLYGRI